MRLASEYVTADHNNIQFIKMMAVFSCIDNILLGFPLTLLCKPFANFFRFYHWMVSLR